MQIDIVLPDTVTVEFPFSQTTINVLRQIGGGKFDGATLLWSFKIVKLAELHQKFPKAEYSNQAREWLTALSPLRIDCARRFCMAMIGNGLSTVIRHDRVAMIHQDGVEFSPMRGSHSPLFEYDAEIRHMLGNGEIFSSVHVAQVAPRPQEATQEQTFTKREELVWKGYANAVEAEKRKAAMIVNRYRKSKRENKQLEISS